MTHSTLAPTGRSARALGWRDWVLGATTAVTVYSAGIAWQAYAVSYPLFSQVSAEEFPAYHLAYNAAIPGVVIAPGFVCFLACAALPWTRPADVPRALTAVVSASGLVSLATTVLWAIPMHDRLDSVGQSAEALAALAQANAVRTGALTLGAGALVWSLLRRRAA
ncbi:hypothetical protein [Cellulomonas cellasea]|uniref:DUF1772 domain-containing protein n=2 Tax=Cellulomonas cellasea TaxID=43670 RepID=A0A0A0B8D8_9CELL|nr:hypothetical protein [Cellulomonas cellasea]KGM02074.1 hypothetical protein Q760_15605 [Cellulomonas cellasea DSM 20118]GEA86767.1 hypothetical protein CCE01nite_07160 [Cellulomonas cellasea]